MYQLKDFGSYMAGGRVHMVSGRPIETIQFTPTTPYQHDPNGHHLVEHAYVQYFVPQERNSEPPVVLVHGGGMTGSMWETTPDGRPGWLHLLLKQGFEVHVVDNVERGRAGWHPGIWAGEPVVRTMEEAWSLFRIGPKVGFASRTPFPGQRFPLSHLEGLCRLFVPRWTSTLDCQAAALAQVLSDLGGAHVICHSQGAQVVFSAAEHCRGSIRQITALEPSGLPEDDASAMEVPIKMVFGDFTNTTPVWRALIDRCESFAHKSGSDVSWLDLAEAGLPGHSHMMMMDEGNEHVLSQVSKFDDCVPG
ncbi:MAG: alpha/beta fold hydrolase [Alphaproteobacteria bacterium]|nr:alpha/beta fold hydrolase [Alphaproteobacteria bacterium]